MSDVDNRCLKSFCKFVVLVSVLATASLSWSDTLPNHLLPQIEPATCSVPAQVRGQLIVDKFVDQINKETNVYQITGSCGTWDLTEIQRRNLGEQLLRDTKIEQNDAECKLLSSKYKKNEPFGTTAEIICNKIFEYQDQSYDVNLIIAVQLDKDNEVVVVFISTTQLPENKE